LNDQQQAETLRNLVNQSLSWPEVAAAMEKSERQVKYQWCYLLSKTHMSSNITNNAHIAVVWTTEMVRVGIFVRVLFTICLGR
jgi:DNA-binding NarL/FixJ family response regulator